MIGIGDRVVETQFKILSPSTGMAQLGSTSAECRMEMKLFSLQKSGSRHW